MRLAALTLILGSLGLASERPNIVLLYSDDHAQAAVGCYGSELCETPHIDALAASGLRFTESFVSNSICGPARAVLLSGQHSHINGQMTNSPGLRPDVPLVSQLLQEAGYRTAVIGKWHLPGDPRGFDHWSLVHGPYYGPTFRGPEGSVARSGHSTDLIAEDVRAWLRDQEGEQPFFLWVCFHASHRTWDPPIRHLTRFQDRDLPEPATLFDDYTGRSPGAAGSQMRISRDLFPAYDLKLPVTGEGILDGARERKLQKLTAEERAAWDRAYGPENEAYLAAKPEGDALTRWNYQRYIKDYLRCVAGMDDAVGSITTELEELGLSDETVVIYTSDQGFFLGEHGWYDKRWMYEPALRTPMVVAGPGVSTGETDALVQNLDLAPTLLELAGAPIPEAMQGLSLDPLLSGEAQTDWRDAIYYHYHQQDAGRTSHTVARHYGMRTERYKLLHVYDHDTWELYDLETDPEEVHNLAEVPEYAELRARLEVRLAALRADVGDTLPGGR